MKDLPTFSSPGDFKDRLSDIEFWSSLVLDVLQRNDLPGSINDIVAGVGGTFPTFLAGKVVVKFFGYLNWWQSSFRTERAAHTLLASDARVKAPVVLAEGTLAGDEVVPESEPESASGSGSGPGSGPGSNSESESRSLSPWSYVIYTRLPGLAWGYLDLCREQKLRIAHALGEQVARVHALKATKEIEAVSGWAPSDVVAACRHSSLAPHLAEQIVEYLDKLAPFDNVFQNGDIMHRHVFVEDGVYSGIIDWGDAIVTDRHYDLAKIHLDLFDCDKELLREFLAASNWPVGNDQSQFCRQALGLALCRQCHGMANHQSMDVFHRLPSHLDQNKFDSLDELAQALFSL